jgi:isopenicillin-N N-acyltransferase-like protein
MASSNHKPDVPGHRLTRRAFSFGLVAGAAGAGGALSGCTWVSTPRRKKVKIAGTAAAAARYEAGSERRMPLLEVKGAPREIGLAIGQRFADQIQGGMKDRAAWFSDLKTFAEAQPANVKKTFLAAAENHTPAALEELRGWAQGSSVPFDDLLILNLKAEYGAMRDATYTVKRPGPAWEEGQPGCSTIALLTPQGKMYLVHNEDGTKAYQDRMFMLHVRPTGKPSFLCASYPGILPGNAPWINDAGVIMTTNFIYSKEVKPGVGRYFLDRTSMEAKNLEQALTICKNPERAYAYHHTIASRWEGRIVSLEVTPSKASLQQLGIGLFIHTNHLVHPAMADLPQDAKYVGTSSETRYKALVGWKQLAEPRVAKLGENDLVTALKSHVGKPYSLCRHPEGAVEGATVLTAAFDVPEGSVHIHKGQPCKDKSDSYVAPSPS